MISSISLARYTEKNDPAGVLVLCLETPSLEISIPIHPPSPPIQDFLLYCSTTPFSEQAVGRKQRPMEDAGQGAARLLRIQPGCDKPGAERVINTEWAPLKELGAGEPEAEDRIPHAFLLGQSGNVSRFLPVGKHQRLQAEGSQSETQQLWHMSCKTLCWRHGGTQPAADMP